MYKNEKLERIFSKASAIKSSSMFRKTEITESEKLLIHQIANGCGLLHQLDVENALNLFVKDKELKSQLSKEIMKIQNRFDNVLYYIKRYPVIFLIDEVN